MSIGTTIKKLRRERNITQEQLAEMLGVSTNAVSQWECDKTAPDISHLPVLANIFEVSADILLEIDIAKSKKQSEIKEFIAECSSLHSQGKTAERLKLCRTMQKKYPNDETVRYYLMRALQNEDIDNGFDEIISLGEQLLESTNTEYRVGAIRVLCLSYLHKGNRDMALHYADMVPQTEDLHVHVLEGDALTHHCRNYFWNLGSRMFLYLKYLTECESAGYTHEEKHSMLSTVYGIFHNIFADGDFGFWHERLAKISFFMAAESAECGQTERSLYELEQMCDSVEKYNGITDITHTSLLVRNVKVDRSDLKKHTEETLPQSTLRYLVYKENKGVFDAIKKDPRYGKIKSKLSAM